MLEATDVTRDICEEGHTNHVNYVALLNLLAQWK